MFLYCAIAFALSQALPKSELYVFENGVTALNLPRRKDLINARVTRTAHPKTIRLLESFLSEIGTSPTIIHTPFCWKTKAEVFQIFGGYSKNSLINSSVSCGRTFLNLEAATHCGSCSQCVDRRLAAFAAECESHDDAGIYKFDFVTEDIADPEARTTLVDYLRQAKDFATWNVDCFYRQMLDDLIDIAAYVGASNDSQGVQQVWDLCNRHGTQVLKGIKRIRDLHDHPFRQLPERSLLRIIAEREYLEKPVQRLAEEVCARLSKALPIAFRSNPPVDENDLNDKIQAFVERDREGYQREHPALVFGLAKVVPDHSMRKHDLLIEAKYLRGQVTASKASEGIAADLTKYPESALKLFVVYDPDRKITDDAAFAKGFETRGFCRVHVIR